MSLGYQILASWRDPAVKAQRKWLFLQFWGRSVNKRIGWFFAYLFFACLCLLMPAELVKGFGYSIGMLCYMHVLSTAEVLVSLKKWRLRAAQLQIVAAQALLLYGVVWCGLGVIIWYRTANSTILFLLSFLLLLMLMLSLMLPQAITNKHPNPLQAEMFQVQGGLIPLALSLGFIVFPQYEWLIRQIFIFSSSCLLIAVIWQFTQFARPRQFANVELVEKCVEKLKPKSKHPMLLQLEMNMGGALDQKGLRKIFVSSFLFPYAFILASQHLLRMPTLDQWGAGALFLMLLPGFLAMFASGRQQWSGSWFTRSHSRSKLWREDEQLFVAVLLFNAVLHSVLMFIFRIDSLTNIFNGALLFVFGLASLRYLVFSLQWMWLYGLSADGRVLQTGAMPTYLSIFPIFIVVSIIWNSGAQNQIHLMIAVFALFSLILAFISYRKALKIDLGAIRRAKRS
ncbi:hypothetical protein HQN60_10925 [Deefgea piscis]|uniref:Uncharacterized protein n=1 Tax=Deefgea piscis TaxID=2739061 RepID=A0A6M8SR78_9NEIS|nr:hypothetical protein [Deefgea piscis]QKJ67171.1 hypothetical protein HQN60_10925 [Deefgea piscis]